MFTLLLLLCLICGLTQIASRKLITDSQFTTQRLAESQLTIHKLLDLQLTTYILTSLQITDWQLAGLHFRITPYFDIGFF